MPDLIPKWVIRWNGVRLGGINIYSQNFSKQGFQRLSVAMWVACQAAIAKASIQITIRAKYHHAAVMIWVRLIYFKQDHFAVLVGSITASLKTRKECVASRASIVNVEESVLGVIGMKSQTQQTHFIAVV